MGCASSKQPKPPKCKHCQTPYSPIRRSYSVHVHHPPSITGDSYHIVALQSSTLGSLRLDEYDALSSTIKRTITHQHNNNNNDYFPDNDDDDEVSTITDKRGEFELGMIEAKKWSQMIDEKITKVIVPKTPIRTPPGEPEMIDAWEMMNGLEDTSPLLRPGGGEHVRSFSFHVCPSDFELESPRSVTARRSEEEEEEEENENEKVSDSIWIGSNVIDKDGGKLISKNLVSEFDPEIVTAFRKALQELSPKHPLHFNRNGAVEDMLRYSDQGKSMMNGITRFHDPDENQTILNGYGVTDNNELEAGYSEHDDENEDPSSKQQQVKNNNSLKLVLYFTSLRGVRRTYENCCSVRLILKSIGVRVDDRDVSMHSVFKEELVELMSKVEVNRSTTTTTTSGLGLPQVFLGEKYIGGADEIRKLHEDGELEKILSCCERMKDDEVSGGGFSCDGCGDIRFVPCETCCGSCKIYYEEENEDEVEVEVEDGDEEDEEVVRKCDDEEEEEEEGNSGESGFQRCPDCNENGLIRCPFCCN